MPVRDDHENGNFVRDDLVEGMRDELPWWIAVIVVSARQLAVNASMCAAFVFSRGAK